MEHNNNSSHNRQKNRYFFLGLTLFLSGAALIGLYYILFHSAKLANVYKFLSDILRPILFGFVMAYVMIPILNCVEGKIVVPLLNKYTKVDTAAQHSKIRGICVAITSISSVLVIYMFANMLISQIVPSIQEIVLNFDSYTDNGINYINKMLEDNPAVRDIFNNTVEAYIDDFDIWLNNTLMPQITSLIKTLSVSVMNILGILWNGIIGFILSIYILNSKDLFSLQAKKIVYGCFSNEVANDILHETRFIHRTFIGFLSGKVLDSAIIGVICFIGTTILKTPYAALVSVIIGITNIIPFFGPFLGAIPCAILIFVVAPMQPLNTVYFVIFIILLQQFDGNILGPKILGDSTGLGSFWVIFAITIFGGLFGIVGMVIGVPAFAVIFACIRRSINKRLTAKGLPIDRDKYARVDYIDEENKIIEMNSENKTSYVKTQKVNKETKKDEKNNKNA